MSLTNLFILVKTGMILLPDDRQRLQRLLPGYIIPSTLTTHSDQDQLQAFTRAAEEGDLHSVKQLEQTFRTANLTEPTPSIMATSSSLTTTLAASSFLPPSAQPPSQLMVLNACDQDIEIMECTEGLCEVLEQV